MRKVLNGPPNSSERGGGAPSQRFRRRVVPAGSRGCGKSRPVLSASKSVLPDLRPQLAAIVEHSNDAIFSRTLDGTITTWNAAARRIFGFSPEEIVGGSTRKLLPRGHQDEFRGLVGRIRRGEIVQHFETVRLNKRGQRLHVSLTLSPIRDAHDTLVGFSTIARDITEQRRALDSLERSERELADLFGAASVGLLWAGGDGEILRANAALLELLEDPAGECVGRKLAQFHPDRVALEDMLRRLAKRETLRNVQTVVRARTGQFKIVLVDASALWEKGLLVHTRWFISDITRRKQLEREVLEISERERRGFAQELHDGLGQQLGGIAYLGNVLRERLAERAAPEAAEAAQIFRLVRNAIEQTRRVARGISPVRPEPEGLMSALRELAAHTIEVFGVVCKVACPKPVFLTDDNASNHLYRIAQEAVNNAIKHGKARRIRISLNQRRDKLTLTLTDNGVGIGQISPRRKGLGLRIMQYRASLLQGTLSITPSRGAGTVVKCVAPCPVVARGTSAR